MEIHNPSLEALSMFKHFLQHYITYSGDNVLKSFVFFAGTFDYNHAFHSIAPLLACQERWGDMEFWSEQLGDMFENVPKFTLDLAKLSSLQGLTVLGSSWHCDLVFCFVNILLDINHNARSLPSLRTARLAYLTAPTYFSIFYSAPNLTQLVINICDDTEISVDLKVALRASTLPAEAS